ncbi:MAG: ParB N-terminal domain-containing protein [Proteobacteria bacterium]|nr:ParB N-terminal domain-containing protein [Pseudomonadota bacterium]
MKIIQAKIEDISWEFYPRAEHSQRQVDLYRQSIDQLPPIAINRNNTGIDGYHRCQAYRQEGFDEIPAVVEDIADEDVLVESIRRNANHGLQLSRADKRRLAVQLFARDVDGELVILMDVSDIASLLSISERSVELYTKSIRDNMRTDEERRIWDMWLSCMSEEEIGQVVGQTGQAIGQRVETLRKSAESFNPEPFQIFNEWRFQRPDERFGIEYPGRIPGQILENLLYYYTDPFDVVWDLFGGGGVTVDVAKLYNRRYLCGDEYTIADMICYPWTVGWEGQGQDINEFKYFKRWFDELSERPAVKKGMAAGSDYGNDFSKLSKEEIATLRKLLYNQRARPAPETGGLEA